MTPLLIEAVTPVHVGDGAAVGSVDRPIIRERHTGWSTLPGSSLKGAARSRAARLGLDSEEIDAWFGPDDSSAAGRIRFGSAVLLLTPARAAHGGFLLLSCPLALARFARATGLDTAIPRPGPEMAWVGSRCGDLLVQPGENDVPSVALIEDLAWPARACEAVDPWASLLGAWLGRGGPLKHLCVVPDAVFTHAARAWCGVRTRASIDPDTGVVAPGRLFSIEAANPETVWWSWLGVAAGRASGGEPWSILPPAEDVWTIGGGVTIGNGRIRWFRRTS